MERLFSSPHFVFFLIVAIEEILKEVPAGLIEQQESIIVVSETIVQFK